MTSLLNVNILWSKLQNSILCTEIFWSAQKITPGVTLRVFLAWLTRHMNLCLHLLRMSSQPLTSSPAHSPGKQGSVTLRAGSLEEGEDQTWCELGQLFHLSTQPRAICSWSLFILRSTPLTHVMAAYAYLWKPVGISKWNDIGSYCLSHIDNTVQLNLNVCS